LTGVLLLVLDPLTVEDGQFLPVSLRPDTFPDRQFSAKQSFNYRTALP